MIDKQTTGERTWDFNTDGAAHYGVVPDWIEDIRIVGGQKVVDDLFAGAESYLRTWGNAEKHQSGTNLASGAAASASTSQWWNPAVNFAPGQAVDGDKGTRWASEWKNDEWLKIDLGSAKPVKRVTLDWEEAYAKSYRIELSQDGESWQTAWSTTAGDGGLDTAWFARAQARYVRIHGLERGTKWGYSLREVGVYSD